MVRESIHQYFFQIARDVATRSTCEKRHVGAVIVDENNHILTTGYNGSVSGLPHCDDIGCDLKYGKCVRTIHAEVNAILQAAKRGVKIDGARIYTTINPCFSCTKLLINAGIKEVWYERFHRNALMFMFESAGLIKFKPQSPL